MNMRTLVVGLTAFAWAGVSLAQECDGFPVTGGCTVNGAAGVPCVGTGGNDVITGTFATNVISGGGGNDLIDGGSGLDVICGDGGNDLIVGGPGGDRLFGGAGNDSLDAQAEGGDELSGGTGDDSLSSAIIPFSGGSLDTLMRGGDGNDDLSGSTGGDFLVGGAGSVDKCHGGSFEVDNISGCELVIQDGFFF
jgi:Ca2+-binding RTX toxin-like protein